MYWETARETGFGTSVWLFLHNFICPGNGMNANNRDAAFRARQSAFKKHIHFPVMYFVYADATAVVLRVTSPTHAKHCQTLPLQSAVC
jgi:hypothetical protein